MSWFTVAIPTRDSAGWIGALLDLYAAHAIRPVILLDGRTRDDTAAIATAHGCRIVAVEDFRFTEGVVSLTRQCVSTPWALFMHDDEAPSAALFDWLAGPEPRTTASSIALSRRWARYEPGEPLRFGRSDHWQDRTGRHGFDHMWRLFRPDRVRFTAAMHSDGFFIGHWARLPPELFFVHFEWVLRTPEQRVMKLRGYDRHRYGYGRFFESMYLPERTPVEMRYATLDEPAMEPLAERFHAARDETVRITPRAPLDHYAFWRHRILSALFPPRPGVEPKDRRGLAPLAENEVPLDPVSESR